MGSNSQNVENSIGTSLTDGGWLHVVYTFDNGTVNVYVDGVKVQEDSSILVEGTAPTTLYATGDGLSMGFVVIYDRVLSHSEVKNNCNALEYRYTASDDICIN